MQSLIVRDMIGGRLLYLLPTVYSYEKSTSCCLHKCLFLVPKKRFTKPFQDRKMPCFHENLPISSTTAGIVYRATQRGQYGGVDQNAENTVDTNERDSFFWKTTRNRAT